MLPNIYLFQEFNCLSSDPPPPTRLWTSASASFVMGNPLIREEVCYAFDFDIQPNRQDKIELEATHCIDQREVCYALGFDV